MWYCMCVLMTLKSSERHLCHCTAVGHQKLNMFSDNKTDVLLVMSLILPDSCVRSTSGLKLFYLQVLAVTNILSFVGLCKYSNVSLHSVIINICNNSFADLSYFYKNIFNFKFYRHMHSYKNVGWAMWLIFLRW